LRAPTATPACGSGRGGWNVVGQQVVTGLEVGAVRPRQAAGWRGEMARQASVPIEGRRKRALMQRGEIDVSVERAGRVVGTRSTARVEWSACSARCWRCHSAEQVEVAPLRSMAQRGVHRPRATAPRSNGLA